MRMYVANASHFIHEFRYNKLGEHKTRVQKIQPRSQIILTDDILTTDDILSIIEQHEKYGFVSVEDVKNGEVKKNTQLIYSVDSEVSAFIIQQVLDYNAGLLKLVGKKRREQLAIVSNNALMNALETQKQTQGIEAEISDVSLSILEEEGKDSNPEPVSEKISVSSDTRETPSRRRRG